MNSWTYRLIALNVILFVLSETSPGLMPAMMLVPAYVLVRPWTVVTYMFMHANFGHILFNMLGLYFFGPRVEEELGGARYLWLYFISGFMGAALSFIFTPYAAIVGASGAIYGVFLAFAYFWPHERIYIWGVVPIESRLMVIGMTALSLFGGFSAGSGIAHFAHLGGFVGAYVYLKLIGRRSLQGPQIVKEVAPVLPSRSAQERWEKIDRNKLHEVNRAELDRIRSKIATQGIESLSAQEIAFMDRFSEDL
ncbi:MAG TPA: rhomboid family intramembrane serine protease [Bacteroidota bacterium]|nr:rhomboid family intramembrane serine protease [Bacteroidota bacterium]